MPSDPVLSTALDVVAVPLQSFRSSVAATVEEVRGLLDAQDRPEEDRSARLGGELGAFAAGRIDPSRLALLLRAPHQIATAEMSHVRRALDVLRSIHSAGDEAFVARLPEGASLATGVEDALAGLGRAFGAARLIESARVGQSGTAEAEGLERFPFRRWNRGEREVAPPLVVELEGSDLRTGGIADVLDGAVKLILVARGETSPAPLARLITPGVMVLQTDDPGDLSRIGAWSGPAVAALVSGSAARFVYEPGPAGAPGELEVSRRPDREAVNRPLDGLSVFQQREELGLLEMLANAPGAPTEASMDGRQGAQDPAGELAAWLLRQADLTGIETDGRGEAPA